MTEYKKLTVTRKHGIDDLKSHNPYPDSEWDNTFIGSFGWTEEQYKADRVGYSKLVDEWNSNYIAELKEKGEYGKEWQTHFNFATLPEFDSTPVNYSGFQILIPKGNNSEPPSPIKWFNDEI